MKKNNKNYSIWAIFKEDNGFSAVKVDDGTYYTAGDRLEEILENIPEVIELLKDDIHTIRPIKEKADFYILVKYTKGKVELVKKAKLIDDLIEFV